MDTNTERNTHGTWVAKTGETEQNWWIIDATDKRIGRLATVIANILRGKNKPTFTPHVDTGDFVVVVNAEKISMTGTKWTEKKYYRHSRFFGSLKEKSAEQVRDQDPTFLLHEAVRGMLPDNKLSYQIIQKLKLHKGPEHPHAAQKPQTYKLN